MNWKCSKMQKNQFHFMVSVKITSMSIRTKTIFIPLIFYCPGFNTLKIYHMVQTKKSKQKKGRNNGWNLSKMLFCAQCLSHRPIFCSRASYRINNSVFSKYVSVGKGSKSDLEKYILWIRLKERSSKMDKWKGTEEFICRTYNCCQKRQITRITFWSSRGVPFTATSALMGTLSGCAGSVASVCSKPTRSSSASPSPIIPPINRK